VVGDGEINFFIINYSQKTKKMKISKLTVLTIAVGVVLLSSCNNDELDIIEEQQVAAPTFSGTIVQLADISASKTKAGVIEDNADYADGELFYWHNDDEIKVLFFEDGDLGSTPVELIYSAVVPNETKPNSCEFTTTGSIDPGNYAVYALYPADGWSKDETGYKAEFVQQNFIIFSEASSAHLKDYMFMKADAGNVTISSEGNNNAINLHFQHLTSVIRFHVTSDTDANSLKINSLTFKEISDANFFYYAAYLNNMNGMDITPVAGSMCPSLHLLPWEELPFVKKGTAWKYDYYLPVFPTKTSTQDMLLGIETYITIDEHNLQQETFDTRNGLSFSDELNFIPNGFEAGKSYYFNLRTTF
jgi:hypothetical protein